jgi:hypothetical protein
MNTGELIDTGALIEILNAISWRGVAVIAIIALAISFCSWNIWRHR